METPTGTMPARQRDVYEEEFGDLLHLRPQRSVYEEFYRQHFRRLITLYKFLPAELIKARVVTLWKKYVELHPDVKQHSKREKPDKSPPRKWRSKAPETNKLYKAVVQVHAEKTPRQITHARKKKPLSPVETLAVPTKKATACSVVTEEENTGSAATDLNKVVPTVPLTSLCPREESTTSPKDHLGPAPNSSEKLTEQNPHAPHQKPDPSQGHPATVNHHKKETSRDVSAEADIVSSASAAPQNAHQFPMLSISFKDEVCADMRETEAFDRDVQHKIESKDDVDSEDDRSTAELTQPDHDRSAHSDLTQDLEDIECCAEEGKETQLDNFDDSQGQSAAHTTKDDKNCSKLKSGADGVIDETVKALANKENEFKKQEVCTDTEANNLFAVPITQPAVRRRSLSLRGRMPRCSTNLQSISEEPEEEMGPAALTDTTKYKNEKAKDENQDEAKLYANISTRAAQSSSAEEGEESEIVKKVGNAEVSPPNDKPSSPGIENDENVTGHWKSLLTNEKMSSNSNAGSAAWKGSNEKKPNEHDPKRNVTPRCSSYLNVLEQKSKASCGKTMETVMQKETANKKSRMEKDCQGEIEECDEKKTSTRWGRCLFQQSLDHRNKEDPLSEVLHADGEVVTADAEIEVQALEDVVNNAENQEQEKEEWQRAMTTAVARAGPVGYGESGHNVTKDKKKKKLTTDSERKKGGSSRDVQVLDVTPENHKQKCKKAAQQGSKDDAEKRTFQPKTEGPRPVEKPPKPPLSSGVITDKNKSVQEAKDQHEQPKRCKSEQEKSGSAESATQQPPPAGKAGDKELDDCTSETKKMAIKKKHKKSAKKNVKEMDAASSWPSLIAMEQTTHTKQTREHDCGDVGWLDLDAEEHPSKDLIDRKLLKKKDKKGWTLEPAASGHLERNESTCQGKLNELRLSNGADQPDSWDYAHKKDPVNGATPSGTELAQEEKILKRKKAGRSATDLTEAAQEHKKSRKSFPSTQVATQAADTKVVKKVQKKKRHSLDAADSWLAFKAEAYAEENPEANLLLKFGPSNKMGANLPKEWLEHVESNGKSCVDKSAEGSHTREMQPSDFPSPNWEPVPTNDRSVPKECGKLSQQIEKPNLAWSTSGAEKTIPDKEKQKRKKREVIDEAIKRSPSSPGKKTKQKGSLKMGSQSKADINIFARLHYGLSEQWAQKAENTKDLSSTKCKTGFGLADDISAETSFARETQSSSSFPSPDWECSLRKYDHKVNRQNAGKPSAKDKISASGSKTQKTPGAIKKQKKEKADNKAIQIKSPIALGDESKVKSSKKVKSRNLGFPVASDYGFSNGWNEDTEDFRKVSFQKPWSTSCPGNSAALMTVGSDSPQPGQMPRSKKRKHKLNRASEDDLLEKAWVGKSSGRKPESPARLIDSKEASDDAMKRKLSLSDKGLEARDSERINTEIKTAHKLRDGTQKVQKHSKFSPVSKKAKCRTEWTLPENCARDYAHDEVETRIVSTNSGKGAIPNAIVGSKSCSAHSKRTEAAKSCLEHEEWPHSGFKILKSTHNEGKAGWISPELFPSDNKNDAYPGRMRPPEKKKKQRVVRFAEPLDHHGSDTTEKENKGTPKGQKNKRTELFHARAPKARHWSPKKSSRDVQKNHKGSEGRTAEEFPSCQTEPQPLEEWDLAELRDSQGNRKLSEFDALTAQRNAKPKKRRKLSQGPTKDNGKSFRVESTFSSSPF